MNKGIALAIFTIFMWAVYDVYVRYVGVNYDVQPLVFISLANMVAALTLLIAGGPGKLGLKTIKNPKTWLWSFYTLTMDIIFVFILLLISTTEANLFIRASIIVSAFFAWMQKDRIPERFHYIGYSMIAVGVFMVADNLPSDVKAISLFLLALMVALQTLRTFTAEEHEESSSAVRVSDKCRVKGYVLLVTSVAFLAFGYILAWTKSGIPDNTLSTYPVLDYLPEFKDFFYMPTVIAAIVLGVFNLSLSNYTYFRSTQMVKSETFLTVGALLPIFTFAFEWLASQANLLSITTITTSDLIAGVIITAGAVVNVIVTNAAKQKNAPKDDKKRIGARGDYELVKDAIHFCENDYQVAAEKLGVKLSVVEDIMAAEGDRGFEVSTSQYRFIAQNYKRNVSMACRMTQLPNRDALEAAISGAIVNKKRFGIVFIDLNKFKPINDTHGHEIGNRVLKKIADRLKQVTPTSSLVSRYGGDEFVIMVRDEEHLEEIEELIDEMASVIERRIRLKDHPDSLEVGASFGYAEYPTNGSSYSELIHYADEEMFADKKASGEGR